MRILFHMKFLVCSNERAAASCSGKPARTVRNSKTSSLRPAVSASSTESDGAALQHVIEISEQIGHRGSPQFILNVNRARMARRGPPQDETAAD